MLRPDQYQILTSESGTKLVPNENCLFRRYLRWAQILILEIFPYIPAVKILARLDLDEKP